MHSQAIAPVLLLSLALPSSGSAAPKDPAARGLDLFVQAPAEVPSGGTLPVQVRVFGFPTIATLTPLGRATVEAVWDAESLGEKIAKVPPSVSVTCDEAGRGHLDIEVPPGRDTLKLLLAARFAGHERTRTLDVKRSAHYQLDLRVSDTKVVPGGGISAWVLLHDQVTGGPAASQVVDLALKEGSLARFSRRLTTDRAGTASAEVPVPFVEDPDESWTLSARTAIGQGDEAEAATTLAVREETPQAPVMRARFAKAAVSPGSPASFTLEVRDGAGQGIANLPLRYWVGQKGTTAPKDDRAWARASTERRTDADGNLTGSVETPRTISPRGSSMTVVAKTLVEGRPLEAASTLLLATPAPEVGIHPEFGVLVPGQSQRLFIHASLDEQPLVAELALEGHGLHARVRTNARGWGEAAWRLPPEIGAKAPEGASTGCAGEVAATVHVRWLSTGPGNATAKPFDRCLPVDRDAVAVVRPDRPMVTAGASLEVRILGGKGSASLLLDGPGHAPWSSAWLPDVERGARVTVPKTARGEWSLGATGLGLGEGQHVLGGRVLVLPAVIPRLIAKRSRTEGAVPRSQVAIEAVLDDGHGRPLTGSVGAVVFDQAGGTRPAHLLALDGRHALAAVAGVEEEDIAPFLDGDRDFEIERWAALARPASAPAAPAFDPQAGMQASIDHAFRRIVHSLEGAVFEASHEPERLRDVRVRTADGSALNPEMLTLVTEAMSEPPVTPGGEPWVLADLMSIDPQVKFDNVARRVTRLKLFQVLAAVRNHAFDKKLDQDEPVLRDPNALLRRMVHDQALTAGDLLDPWGHGLSFLRSAGPRIPFLSTVPGFRLISAGPDGRFGTTDDVQDPFQRVLASRTPYARAVGEDRLVDAKWDMQVGDETVEAWKNLLHEVTGDVLGELVGNEIGEAYGVGSLGLSGTGTGGGGTGEGTLGRASFGIDPGAARWLAPVRTDAQGRARLLVPLGDAETIWQIVLVAAPDDGLPATASVEVPTSLPLSIRANTGATWTVGDEVEVGVRVRNRTAEPVTAVLLVAAGGAAQLVDARQARQSVVVAAQSATNVYLRVRGTGEGTGSLEISVQGNGHADRLHHEWLIKAAGETYLAQHALWADATTTLAVPPATETTPARGPARLVLERGLEPALAAVVDSLAPDHLAGAGAFADALEVLGRIHAWALVRGGDTHGLAVRSRELARQVSERRERQRKHQSPADADRAVALRGDYWAAIANPPQAGTGRPRDECPSTKAASLPAALEWLTLAASSDRKTEHACWAALRASALGQLAKENDPLVLARVVLVFQSMPGQAQIASALATRLLAAVPIRLDGTLLLPEPLAGQRAARSTVLVAIARTTPGWPASQQTLAGKLWSRLFVERDPRGGYGSSEATRHVVTALLRKTETAAGKTTVRYTELSDRGKPLGQGQLELPASGNASATLSPGTASVRVDAPSSGLLVRTERRLFRSFLRPVEPTDSPLHLDLAMPKPPARGGLASLQVTLHHDLGRTVPVTVRIPLPPGAALAESVPDISQVQGAIHARTQLDDDGLLRLIEIPLRFALAGRVTMPEATARVTDDEVVPARAPARPFVIAPSPP